MVLVLELLMRSLRRLLVTILVINLLLHLARRHGHIVIKTEGVTADQLIPSDTFLLLFIMLGINNLGSDSLLSSQNGGSFLVGIGGGGVNCGCSIP